MQKGFKDIKENKASKMKFKYSQEDIIEFLETNVAASILIALVILFIVIGSPFVVGALIGGYFGAKRAENLRIISSSLNPLILGATIGAVLGGIILIFSVSIGRYFHTIGGILGALAGVSAIVAFSGDLTEKITSKLMKFSSIKNTSKESEESSKKKKSKATRKKSKTSKKKVVSKKK
jgi:hypothetical protein